VTAKRQQSHAELLGSIPAFIPPGILTRLQPHKAAHPGSLSDAGGTSLSQGTKRKGRQKLRRWQHPVAGGDPCTSPHRRGAEGAEASLLFTKPQRTKAGGRARQEAGQWCRRGWGCRAPAPMPAPQPQLWTPGPAPQSLRQADVCMQPGSWDVVQISALAKAGEVLKDSHEAVCRAESTSSKQRTSHRCLPCNSPCLHTKPQHRPQLRVHTHTLWVINSPPPPIPPAQAPGYLYTPSQMGPFFYTEALPAETNTSPQQSAGGEKGGLFMLQGSPRELLPLPGSSCGGEAIFLHLRVPAPAPH